MDVMDLPPMNFRQVELREVIANGCFNCNCWKSASELQTLACVVHLISQRLSTWSMMKRLRKHGQPVARTCTSMCMIQGLGAYGSSLKMGCEPLPMSWDACCEKGESAADCCLAKRDGPISCDACCERVDSTADCCLAKRDGPTLPEGTDARGDSNSTRADRGCSPLPAAGNRQNLDIDSFQERVDDH